MTVYTELINQRDVPISNVNKNEFCLPRPLELNEQTCFQSQRLTKIINTVLTLALLHYYILLHFYYKLCWFM